MIGVYQGHRPLLASSARVAENSTIIGNVQLGEEVSLWYGAVIRGDSGRIAVGDRSNIQDGCILHGSRITIGQGVTIGHGAIVHGCTVEDNCLIGMGAILLDGCVIGEGSIVGAGALVPEGRIIPPGSLAVGVPARVLRSLTEEEMDRNRANADHYVEEGVRQLPAAVDIDQI